MPTGSARDTLLRHWRLLMLVPHRPRALTVAALSAGLRAEGFVVTRRTVERDLQKLSSVGFPLSCEAVDGIQHWSLLDGRTRWLPPLPTVNDAVLLLLARDYLTPLLPPMLRRVLAPAFLQAEGVLEQARATSQLARWRGKVKAILPTQPLLAPPIAPAVRDTCMEALLQERQLSVSYDSRSRAARQRLVLNPHALLQRGLITYVVATAQPHADPRLYALHRMRTARLLESPMSRAPGFSLQSFLSAGFADFGRGRRIRIRLRVSPSVATHLAECRLSHDQRITRLRRPDGWCRVTATVNDTPQLRWWIQGFGSDVHPEHLPG